MPAISFNGLAASSLKTSIHNPAHISLHQLRAKLLTIEPEMRTVAKLNNGQPNSGHYGFGWFVVTKNGHRVVEHEGAWQGFETQISRFVDDKLTVVVLTNLDDAKPEVFADRVAEMYLSGTVK